MEFVAFVLYTAVIVQTSAAPLEASYPHHNNQFDLPEIARKGFELTLEVPIDEIFEEKLQNQPLTVILEPHDQSKFCGNENVKGLHICIVPDETVLVNKSASESQTTLELRIKAIVNLANEDELIYQVYLNGNNKADENAIAFETFKHVSMGGVIGDIKKLHFDFTGQPKGS